MALTVVTQPGEALAFNPNEVKALITQTIQDVSLHLVTNDHTVELLYTSSTEMAQMRGPLAAALPTPLKDIQLNDLRVTVYKPVKAVKVDEKDLEIFFEGSPSFVIECSYAADALKVLNELASL